MFPNDYEKVMKRHREDRQRQREQERQKEIEDREKYTKSYLAKNTKMCPRVFSGRLNRLLTPILVQEKERET